LPEDFPNETRQDCSCQFFYRLDAILVSEHLRMMLINSGYVLSVLNSTETVSFLINLIMMQELLAVVWVCYKFSVHCVCGFLAMQGSVQFHVDSRLICDFVARAKLDELWW